MKQDNGTLWVVFAILWTLNFAFTVLVTWAGLNLVADFGFSFWEIIGIAGVLNFAREPIATATPQA